MADKGLCQLKAPEATGERGRRFDGASGGFKVSLRKSTFPQSRLTQNTHSAVP